MAILASLFNLCVLLLSLFLWLKLGELKLGELLDTPPPGLDEAIAISKVCLFWLANMLKIFFALLLMFNPLSR